MADTLVERCTGQTTADAVAVEVQVVVPASTLVADSGDPDRDAPGQLLGFGPVPAELVRDLVRERPASASTWLRRLFASPAGGLVAMESRRRTFTAGQRRFVSTRDQYCRTPWCEACNYAKQAPGWSARTDGDGLAPDIVITTPTGHRYRSRAPVLFRPPRPVRVDGLGHRVA